MADGKLIEERAELRERRLNLLSLRVEGLRPPRQPPAHRLRLQLQLIMSEAEAEADAVTVAALVLRRRRKKRVLKCDALINRTK